MTRATVRCPGGRTKATAAPMSRDELASSPHPNAPTAPPLLPATLERTDLESRHPRAGEPEPTRGWKLSTPTNPRTHSSRTFHGVPAWEPDLARSDGRRGTVGPGHLLADAVW